MLLFTCLPCCQVLPKATLGSAAQAAGRVGQHERRRVLLDHARNEGGTRLVCEHGSQLCSKRNVPGPTCNIPSECLHQRMPRKSCAPHSFSNDKAYQQLLKHLIAKLHFLYLLLVHQVLISLV